MFQESENNVMENERWDAEEEKSNLTTGKVKWFNAIKGYGFIESDKGGQDIFVHITAVLSAGLRTLEENQRIAFEVTSGKNGKSSATSLRVL